MNNLSGIDHKDTEKYDTIDLDGQIGHLLWNQGVNPAEAKVVLLYDLDVISCSLCRIFTFYLQIYDNEKYVTDFSK